jgi:hypothetical protein
MGAGIIPFCQRNNQVHFLFHKTFSGRREGFLVDFGGGGKPGESYRDTAIREFVEETETMYFEHDLSRARRTPERVRDHIDHFSTVFDATQEQFPQWCCRRSPGSRQPPKDWMTFFVAVEERDIEAMNTAWQTDRDGRFKKPRHLLWISGDELLQIYAHGPKRLWKRVRQLQGVEMIIAEIIATAR